MLPTFANGLREGMEAVLIVGIVAAFLGEQGRRSALRQVWIGVAVAVLIGVGVGVGLADHSDDLPLRRQEGLETVMGLVAVVMVTYMVLWMGRHARDLKHDLEQQAKSALAGGVPRRAQRVHPAHRERHLRRSGWTRPRWTLRGRPFHLTRRVQRRLDRVLRARFSFMMVI